MEFTWPFLILALVASYGLVLRINSGGGAARHRNAPFICVQVVFLLASICLGVGGGVRSNVWHYIGTVLFELTTYFLLMWSGINLRAVNSDSWRVSRPGVLLFFSVANIFILCCYALAGSKAWDTVYLAAVAEYLPNIWYWAATLTEAVYLLLTTALFLYEVYDGWRTATDGAGSDFRYRCITLLVIESGASFFYGVTVLGLLYYRVTQNLPVTVTMATLASLINVPNLLFWAIISIPLTDKWLQRRYEARQDKFLVQHQTSLQQLLSRLPDEFEAVFPDKVETDAGLISTAARRRALRILVKRLDIVRAVFYRAEILRRGQTTENAPVAEISPFPLSKEVVMWEEYIGPAGRSTLALFFAQHYIPVVLASTATTEQKARFYRRIERQLEKRLGKGSMTAPQSAVRA